MIKSRLLRLARLLEADARKKTGVKFNLSTVVTVIEPPRGNRIKLDCGTQACAMGLAALSGEFKRQGLSYSIDGLFIDTTFKGTVTAFDAAAMALFDITECEAHFLFIPASYPQLDSVQGSDAELYVAKRIRKFVATGRVSR